MKRLLIPFLLTVWFALSLRASEEPLPSYRQAYVILIQGAISGSETMTEQVAPDGNVLTSSAHEILVTDGIETKRMAFTTAMTLRKGTWTPISYSCRYSSGEARDSYEVAVSGAQVVRILNRSGKPHEARIQLQPGFVIVDFNVYYQYDYLLRRYDLKKGGRQTFTSFLPLIAADIPIALTRLEDSSLGSGEKALRAYNFRVEFGSSWVGTVCSDKNGRLIRLLIRDRGLEVVRKDLVPE